MAASGGAMRASDQEREATVRILRDAFVDGRLDLGELHDRAGAAYRARTWADLSGLIDDLPTGAGLLMRADFPVRSGAGRLAGPGARAAPMLLIVLAVLALAVAAWASAAFIPLVLLSLSVLSAARCSALSAGRPGRRAVGQIDDTAGHDGE